MSLLIPQGLTCLECSWYARHFVLCVYLHWVVLSWSVWYRLLLTILQVKTWVTGYVICSRSLMWRRASLALIITWWYCFLPYSWGWLGGEPFIHDNIFDAWQILAYIRYSFTGCRWKKRGELLIMCGMSSKRVVWRWMTVSLETEWTPLIKNETMGHKWCGLKKKD